MDGGFVLPQLTLADAAEALGLPDKPQTVFRGHLRYWITPGGREFRGARSEFWAQAALPYGAWTCADGRRVLFNWRYEPIWQCTGDGAVARADPTERVPWAEQEWFYGGLAGPLWPWRSDAALSLCLRALAEFGVLGRPL
jgi:hypothetical protein